MTNNFSNEKFNKQFEEQHQGTLKKMLAIYWSNKPIWKSTYFRIALLFAILIQIITKYLASNYHDLIIFIGDKMLTIMPNILGFNMGGYALLVGFNSHNILKEITEPTTDNSYSFFQKQSSLFAFSLLIQALAIIITYFVLLTIELNKDIYISGTTALIINSVVFFILNFICFYAIFLIIAIVVDLFNFGQILHFFVRIDQIEIERDENLKQKNN